MDTRISLNAKQCRLSSVGRNPPGHFPPASYRYYRDIEIVQLINPRVGCCHGAFHGRAGIGWIMTHTVCEPCNDCKYTDCVAVCPVECFYQDDMMLYIDPADCIDCEACVPECPVEAIFAEANVPSQWAELHGRSMPNKAAALKAAGDGHITEKQTPRKVLVQEEVSGSSQCAQ